MAFHHHHTTWKHYW